ncbi:DHS-like NAD/FAD-binding domain-containing protein [Obelidium mucronatum]|nr:DHS-like NAD/FAD-binding domain-containing protein [Obelidium mucronatum]
MSSHLIAHHEETMHPIAASFADLSIYCYECADYIICNESLPILDALHWGRFGESHPIALQYQNTAPTSSSSSSEPPLEFLKMDQSPPEREYPRFTNVVILTGAGISKESGINTFRDAGGLWETHRPEELATPEAFERDPAMVQRFYNWRRAKVLEVEPNVAHEALAELEAELKVRGVRFLLVTQNIDDLHERAGSENLVHMHGEICKVQCVKTQQVFSWYGPVLEDSRCDCCRSLGTLRPRVVWFGEMPLWMGKIRQALKSADLFVSIGTSGLVYPAAGFVGEVPKGAVTIELNFEETAVSEAFSEHRVGPATKTVPKLVDDILSACS